MNNVAFNKLYRILVDASVKPRTPVHIWMDKTVKGPDGMRAANGKLFVTENDDGKISALTIDGDKASVAVITGRTQTPTGVEPAGDTLWFTERAIGKAESISIRK